MFRKTLQLADFDLTRCEVVKETVLWLDGQDHSRWVLKTDSGGFGRNGLYLKIWNPSYVRRDNILAGIEVGFYDEQTTPALMGPIFHDGVCRGYVTNGCTRYWGRRWEAGFYRLIQDKSAKTGYFSYQFSRDHVMRFKNQPSLIDLEGIYPVGDLPALATYHGTFDDERYQGYIAGLYRERFHALETPTPNRAVASTPRRRGLSLLIAGASLVWRESIAGFRERKRMTRHHLDLIQR